MHGRATRGVQGWFALATSGVRPGARIGQVAGVELFCAQPIWRCVVCWAALWHGPQNSGPGEISGLRLQCGSNRLQHGEMLIAFDICGVDLKVQPPYPISGPAPHMLPANFQRLLRRLSGVVGASIERDDDGSRSLWSVLSA